MKNILLLGTCRIRSIVCSTKSSKYNFINYGDNFIGRTYSLYDTYELLNLLLQKKTNIISHEFRHLNNQFKKNIKKLLLNIDNIDIYLIEISSIKYYTHNIKCDSKLLFSPNFPKVKGNYKLNILSEKEMDFYFKKLINLIGNKKIFFVYHLKSNIIPNRKLILNNLRKNILLANKENILLANKENIILIIPEELFKENINCYLVDNHYNVNKYELIIIFYHLLIKI